MNPSLERKQHWLWLVLLALLLGWLAVSMQRLGRQSPFDSPLDDGWRYRLEQPLAVFGEQDGGLKVISLLAPKAKLPTINGPLSEGNFSHLAQKAGIGGRWLRKTRQALDSSGSLEPPYVALLNQPVRRYVLVRALNPDVVIADDPVAGRVAYRRERFKRAWLSADGYGLVYVLYQNPEARPERP